MTKVLAATRVLLDTVTLAQQTTAPGTTTDNPGSWWIRSGALPTTPVEHYLKILNGSSGWCKQNLINLNVFNVKAFGAKGDGATDDTAAINAAIAAAAAAGGGVVYFPATAPGSYRITKPSPGVLGSLLFDNKHDIALLGDGPASTIAMIGSAGAGDWYAVRIRDGSTRLGFYNLGWDGSGLTNPDPAEQNHFLDINGVAGDVHGGPSNIDVVGNFFGTIVGDCVRNLGESTEIVDNVRVLYNCANLSNINRSFVEAQRFSHHIQIKFNWATDTKSDNVIDFEPTGGAGGGIAGPEEWSILGNHVFHGDPGSDAITLSGTGTGDPSTRNLFAFNTINGGSINGVNVLSCLLKGNMVFCANGTVDPCLYFTSRFENVTIDSNVIVSLDDANARFAIDVVASVSSGFRALITNNLCKVVFTQPAGGAGFNLESFVECAAVGNLIYFDNNQAGKGFGIEYRSSNAEVDQVNAIGNLIIVPNAAIGSAAQFHAGPNTFHNSLASYNFIDNATVAVGWDRGAAEVFANWRLAGCNVITSPTTATISPPPTNVGATVAGMAGPGPQFTQAAVVPNTAVTAPAGSVELNSLGAAATCLWYKETGSGVSGGNTGWIQDGGSDFQFGTQDVTNATAARFLAPGMAQATASVVEIQVPLPRPGTVRNLRLTATAGVGTGSNTYTLRRNGSDTSVTVTVANNAASGVGGGLAVCAAGDLLSMRVTKSVAPATDQTNVVANLELSG